MITVEFQHVFKNFVKGFARDSLRDLNFCLNEGESLVISGLNDPGKLSILETIMGISPIDSGKILIFGREYQPELREDIGFVFNENLGVFDVFKVDDLNKLMSELFSKWNCEKYYNYVQKFNIPKDKPYYQLSRGKQKKLDIAVALAHSAKLLLLDDPTTSIDDDERNEILKILKEYQNDNNTLIIASCFPSQFADLCDYIAILNDDKFLSFDRLTNIIGKYCKIRITPAEFKFFDSSLVISKRKKDNFFEVIVERANVPEGSYKTYNVTLDEIIYLIR